MPSIVSTGQLTIVDQNDVAYLKLSNDSCTVPTDSIGFNGDYSGCFTTAGVVLGNQDDSSGWTYTAIPGDGVEGNFAGRTYQVTNVANGSGYVMINAEKIGFPTLTAQFSIAKAMRGTAGQSLTIVPSNQGFSFTDGQATFPDQVISLTVLKKDVSGPVQWFAEDGVTLTTDPNESGAASLTGFMFGMGGAITGEVAYLHVSQLEGREQVVVTAVCDGVTATHTVVRLDSSTAQAGATRNVFRGNWAAAVSYAVGDTVIHEGYGWSCKEAHTSSASILPPTYPVESNTQWALSTVKGVDAKLAYLTASSYVVTVNADGTLTPASITLDALGQAVAGSPTFTVDSGTVTLAGTGNTRTINTSTLTTDQAKIKITWDGLVDTVTIAKVKTGADSILAVVSNEAHVLPAATNGTVSSYTNSGTTIEVYEGNTLLTASATATVSAFRIGTITQAPASTIAVGAVSYSGTTATIAQHSGMSTGQDTVSLIIPITVYRANGTSVTIRKVQTLSKSKTGATGATGATGISGLNFSEAKSLFLDPTFQTGSNSIALYNNSGGGTVTITREAKQTDSPFDDSGFNLNISNTGTASPGIGGFVNNFNGRASAVFVQRFIAKIPVGYTLADASNAMGDGYTATWLTSKAGTGKFEEYILVRRCGATGSFSSSGHIYLVGPTGTPAAPVNWYLAYSAAYDFSSIGFASVVASLSNDSHSVSADSAGNNGVYTGAVSTMTIYNGATDDSANWTVKAAPSSGVTGSLAGKTYTVTAMTVDSGYVDLTAARSGYSSVTKRFTLTKSKAGTAGATGAQGPAVVITSSRAATFTATDGTLDGSQADIVYTAAVSGITSPTYVWSFTGLQTNPTASTTNTQTITAAQFGTSKGATVACTVSGTYKDTETIVRLEKSTAAPGATSGSNLIMKGVFDDGKPGSWDYAGIENRVNAGMPYAKNIYFHARENLEKDASFPVTPGEVIHAAGWLETLGITSYNCHIGLQVLNAAGAVVTNGWMTIASIATNTPWTFIKGSAAIPADGVKAVPRVFMDGFDFPANYQWVRAAGLYIGRHEQGATVGAPNGTLVGGTLAETVASKANDAVQASGNNILSGTTSISSTYNAGIRVGNLQWYADGGVISGKGVAITSGGIVGHNGTKPTFAVNASNGEAYFSGRVSGSSFVTGGYNAWAWPAAGQNGCYLGPEGLLLGNYNDSKYFQVTSEGNVYAPGMKIENGTLTISQANVINTLQLAGNAVTVPKSASLVDDGVVDPYSADTTKIVFSFNLNAEGQPIWIHLHGKTTSGAYISQATTRGTWATKTEIMVDGSVVAASYDETLVLTALVTGGTNRLIQVRISYVLTSGWQVGGQGEAKILAGATVFAIGTKR